MSTVEKAFTGAWGVNLLAACALNLRELGHALGVLLVFSATFFLVAAPLHLLLALSAWALYRAECASSAANGAPYRACARVVCAETVLFWAMYWGMVLNVVPLQIKI